MTEKINPPSWPSYLPDDIKNNKSGIQDWFKLNDKSLSKLFHIVPGNEQQHDSINSYTYNSLKFRSPEFTDNPDIIAIGCSHTWGVGVPDDTPWPSVLSKLTGYSYANLGMPGASIMDCVLSAMAYIKKHGKPKYIVALLPDFKRMTLVQRTDINSQLIDERNADKYEGQENLLSYGPIFFSDPGEGGLSQTVRLSKRPHVYSEVLSLETPLYLSLSYINLLQAYCYEAGIKLVMSSWDDDTVDVFRTLEVDNFHFLEYERDTHMDDGVYVCGCHIDENERYGDNWYRGADHTKEFAGHIGVHRHLDYAELFLDAINREEEV